MDPAVSGRRASTVVSPSGYLSGLCDLDRAGPSNRKLPRAKDVGFVGPQPDSPPFLRRAGNDRHHRCRASGFLVGGDQVQHPTVAEAEMCGAAWVAVPVPQVRRLPAGLDEPPGDEGFVVVLVGLERRVLVVGVCTWSDGFDDDTRAGVRIVAAE